MRSLITFMLVGFTVGCMSHDIRYIHPSIKNWLQIRHRDSDNEISNKTSSLSTLWKNEDLTLQFDNKIAFPKELNSKFLVMVSYPFESVLSKEFGKTHDDAVLFADRGSDGHAGFALLHLEDTAELDALAMTAHSLSHPVCGAIEGLNLLLTTIPLKIIPAIYGEMLPLSETKNFIAQTSTQRLSDTIQTLENMGTRFHSSPKALDATQTVADLFTTAGVSGLPGYTVTQVSLSQSAQKSVIATLPGQTDDQTTVIIGAHLDSINAGGADLMAPGADDDASGIATLTEIIHILAQNNAKFNRRIEFQAYAAEEVGLFGSASIAQNYAQNGRQVAGMMQFDMNSWSTNPGKHVYLVTNNTTPTLRRSVKDLLATYFDSDFEEGTLSAGTSDHKSWTNAGFPAVFPFENPVAYNHALHSVKDTSTTINNLPLSERMVQLGLAYLIHHAGLINAESGAKVAFAKFRTETPRDIQIALVNAQSAEDYELSVATDKGISAVEICVIQTPGGVGCTGERMMGSVVSDNNSRRFFGFSDYIKLPDNTRLALFAYNEKAQIVDQRSVLVKKK